MAAENLPAQPPGDMSDSARYRRMFDDYRSSPTVQNSRLKAQKCRDYYDDKQLDRKAKAVLRKRGQPETVRNRIKPAVNGVLGVLVQAKVDPRAYPRNPKDEDGADVASKALRYIADVARFHAQKIDVADNHLVEGCAAVIIEADAKKDVIVTRIPWEEFFYDPRSREANYADARYMGVAKWMYADDVARMYPDYADAINSASQGNWSDFFTSDTTWQDRPDDNPTSWIDRKLRRLMVVEMYHLDDGKWRHCVFFAGGVLRETDSPYVDDEGSPINPMEGSSCFIDRENGRYGIVQAMLPLQDELNARASRLLHLTNTRQLQVPDINNPPNVDADTARAEASRADGVIPTGYQVAPVADMAAGNAAIMAEVKGEIDRQAPTPAVLGREDQQSQSGRSRLVLQQAGMTELARALGRLEDWENRVYRQMWLRAKQFWDEPKWVRVTGDDGAAEFVQVNEPVYQMEPQTNPDGSPVINPETGQPQERRALIPQPVKGPDGQPVVDPQTGQPQIQPQPLQIGVKNRLIEMDMDIEVDTVPDTANLAAEQFETFAKLAPQMAAAYGPKATVDALLRLSTIPGKRDIQDMLKTAAAEQEKAQAAAQQAQSQIQAAEFQSKQALTAAQADEASARAERLRGEGPALAAKHGAQAEQANAGATLDKTKAGEIALRVQHDIATETAQMAAQPIQTGADAVA